MPDPICGRPGSRIDIRGGNMRTRSIGLSLFAVLALAASACTNGGSSPSPTSGTSTTTPASQTASSQPSASAAATVTCTTKLKIGLVTDVGRINDKGFNQSAYEGMQQAAQDAPTCFDTSYVETQSQSDYAKNIASYTDANYDVVIGVGFLLGNDLGDAAIANPNIKFISVDGVPSAPHDTSWMTNGESLFFAEDQAGYLAGVLAASVTKSNHVGVVGGLLVVPPVERFVEGYANGARSVKSDIKVDFVYTTSFVDPPQGNNAAKQMIDKGADVIFAAGGLTGNGALSAACEGTNVYGIGVDTDQFLTLPEVDKCLLSSATKNVKGAVHDSLLRIAQSQFKAGFHTDDAKTGGISLAPFHDMDAQVPQAVKDLLDTTNKGLADGSIKTNVKVDGKTVIPATGPIP
jgi:basic membrane protein A